MNQRTSQHSTAGLSEERRRLFELMLRRKGLAAASPNKIQRRATAGRCVASFNQQRLWLFAQKKNSEAVCNVYQALRLEGTLDRQALQAALDTILARHEVLRTGIEVAEDGLWQVIRPFSRFVLETSDVTHLSPSERESEVRCHATQEVLTPFDLNSGPMIRGRLIRLAEQEHILMLTLHRIACDGWSRGVLARDLAALYAANRQGAGSPLQPLEIQYADYAQWQRQSLTAAVLQEGVAYWLRELADAPARLLLPTDRPRKPTRGFAGAAVPVKLSAELTACLKASAARWNLTLFMILHAGWSILLSRLSGQDDIVVGMPVANRQHTQLEGMIGCFVNFLALRLRIRPDQSVQELLARTKDVTLAAYEHQWVPFLEVVGALGASAESDYHPVFQVAINLVNTPQAATRLPGLTLTLQRDPMRMAEYDLSLFLMEREGCLVGELIYATELFDCATVEQWNEHFEAILTSMVRDVAGKVQDAGTTRPEG